MMQPPIPLNIIQTGNSELSPTSSLSETDSPLSKGTNCGTPSSNRLKSNAKPHEILERVPVEPRILKISNADVAALCQVITEFKEQFIEY
jgi:hypothetical protein